MKPLLSLADAMYALTRPGLDLHPHARWIAMCLLRRADRATAKTRPEYPVSVKSLAKDCGCWESTVRVHLRTLEECGFVAVEKQRDARSGATLANLYAFQVPKFARARGPELARVQPRGESADELIPGDIARSVIASLKSRAAAGGGVPQRPR